MNRLPGLYRELILRDTRLGAPQLMSGYFRRHGTQLQSGDPLDQSTASPPVNPFGVGRCAPLTGGEPALGAG
jgi:hypothetical protein